jgi:cellulose synthase/poly-beta-1,6-N-acetylglucosamine synthase-like glycosyltransferase
MAHWFEAVLWSSVLMIVLVTVGYPLTLALAGLLFRRPRQLTDCEPTVTLIIAAHNEEACIASKLENTLALDYPRGRLEIIVASDGSTDRTADIVRSYADRGIVLREFPRVGKTGMQNQVARSANGEILVFSDANAAYRPDAIRKLVRNFVDPAVACASGQLIYESRQASAGDGEQSYWNYEKFLKRCESDLSSLIGANGSIYAVRRTDYVEIDSDLISDLVEPLALVRSGKRVVYEPDAISVEEASSNYAVEFKRKVRILTRSINGLLHMRALFNPFRYGIFSLQLVVHKLLRYLVPVFLATSLTSLLALAVLGQYRAVLLAVALALTAAMLVGKGILPRWSNPAVRACHLLYYYLMVNYALVPAWINIFRRTRVTVWVPERKGA